MLEYIKWTGTACVIAAAGLRGLGLHEADITISILGACLWGYAAIAMKDKPLFVVNAFVIMALVIGIFFQFF